MNRLVNCNAIIILVWVLWFSKLKILKSNEAFWSSSLANSTTNSEFSAFRFFSDFPLKKSHSSTAELKVFVRFSTFWLNKTVSGWALHWGSPKVIWRLIIWFSIFSIQLFSALKISNWKFQIEPPTCLLRSAWIHFLSSVTSFVLFTFLVLSPLLSALNFASSCSNSKWFEEKLTVRIQSFEEKLPVHLRTRPVEINKLMPLPADHKRSFRCPICKNRWFATREIRNSHVLRHEVRLQEDHCLTFILTSF